MTNVRFKRWGLTAAATFVAAAALLTASATNITAQSGESDPTAQSGDPSLRIVAPTEEVKEGDENVPFEIYVDNVENLAGFQFVLQYRDDVFDFAGAQQGPFLSSTEREVVCEEPLSDAGSTRYTCITLRMEPEGASGSGHLATIMLNATGSGPTDVTLDRISLLRVDADASEIEGVTSQGTTIEVTSTSSTNWLLWGGIIAAAIIIVGGVGAFAATRMRNSDTPSATKAESPQ